MLEGAWLAGARIRRNFQRALRPLGPVDATIDEVAPGRSFADIGAIWSVHGRTAFLAEEKGAGPVTAFDIQDATPEFERERERRGSSVRFVRGDIHDPAALEELGPHDVIWCSGVLYHVPNPMHTIDCLRSVTRQTLVLITASVPETPGVRNGAVFFPGLPERARRAYDRAFNAASNVKAERVGLTTPFNEDDKYAAWWWGMTPSSLAAMLMASGFTVRETKTNGFHTRLVADVA